MKKSRITFALAITLALSFLTPPAAHAADKGYRYWGYFQAAPGATMWTMAMTGPTVNIPDGSVEGWAFTFSSDSVPDAATPRISPDFSHICGATRAIAGKKRVGITIDFGSAFIKPKGETVPRSFSKCVVIEKSALGIDVLGKIVKLRTEGSGLICSLNSYPAKECGAEISTPSALLKK
ncbi:MAG: SCO2322 family protein [Actinobacteria bacterium]|nr:SCO2322 family protein [Actinomycetota bacterium]